MVDAPPDVLQALKERTTATNALRNTLVDELAELKPDWQTSSSPLEQAQIAMAQYEAALAIGVSLDSLAGEGDDGEAWRMQRTQLQAYSRKVKAAVAADELGRAKRTLTVDVEASHRFIQAALPDLSAGSKEQLKQVAATAAANNDGSAKPSLLSQARQAKNGTVAAGKGASAADRAKRRRLGRSSDGSKRRDKALDFLQELDADMQGKLA